MNITEYMEEEFEDTKGVIRIRNSLNRQHNGQQKKDKGQTAIDKAYTSIKNE
jgi:hypothetical protein